MTLAQQFNKIFHTMEKIKYYLMAAFFAMVSLSSCQTNKYGFVPENVKKAFQSQYPKAINVEWEQEKGYYVCEFNFERREANAWYTKDAVWKLTEFDVRYSQLPQVVIAAFEGSEYANWKIDDIDKLDRPNMGLVYVLEVESKDTEVDLYYAADGKLIKTMQGDYDSDYINDAGANMTK